MTLTERLTELLRAAFSGIWIRSYEPDDAVAEIASLCRAQKWTLATWDIDRGLNAGGTVTDAPDPLAALRALTGLATADGTAVLVLRNFHRFVSSIEIVQALETALARGKQDRTFVVVLAPVVQIPAELERQFVVVEHELPDLQQLAAIARSVAAEPGELPDGPAFEAVIEAAGGLTRLEAEGAFALSIVRHGRVEPAPLWELKAGMLRKSGLLSLHRGGESFAGLGGLDALKCFCARVLRPGGGPNRPRARGIMLLGVPGTGKSAFCKALGRETNRPTIILDVGALKGSLVGETEQRTRQALSQIDRMAPSVVMVDEVEKGLAGAQGSGVNDSGVTAGMFGTLLSWLNDHESDTFFVATCNDIAKLPTEFARAERFDGLFFLDLPGRAEKDVIWRIYQQLYGLDSKLPRPADTDWTGAEIKACCRLAALLEVPPIESAYNIVPVAVTAAEQVEKLRTWASGRCLDAQRGGIYVRSIGTDSKPSRTVRRGDPTAN